MRPVAWLELAGVEIGNPNRVLTYLRRGFAGTQWNVELRADRYTEGACGYEDAYPDPDVYEGDCYYSPRNLACYCEPISELGYDSPAGAPWYDPARPESYDFLGFLPNEIDVQPVLARAVSAKAVGGGNVGRLRPKHRIIAVGGTMFAANAQGMSWGERWLEQALTGADTAAGCAHDVLRLLPSCPEEPDTDRFFREIHQVGVVDGPVYGRIEEVKGCTVQQVSFQLAGGSEYLFAPAVDILSQRSLPAAPAQYALLDAPLYFSAAAIITIHAGTIGSSMQNVTVSIAPASSSVCPSATPATFSFTIDYVPRGGHIVIDASRRRVVVYSDDAETTIYSGLDALTWTGSWEWAVAEPGTEYCISIDGAGASLNPGSLVQVQQVDREL